MDFFDVCKSINLFFYGFLSCKNDLKVSMYIFVCSQSLLHLVNLHASKCWQPKLPMCSADVTTTATNIAICCIDKNSANSASYEESFLLSFLSPYIYAYILFLTVNLVEMYIYVNKLQKLADSTADNTFIQNS